MTASDTSSKTASKPVRMATTATRILRSTITPEKIQETIRGYYFDSLTGFTSASNLRKVMMRDNIVVPLKVIKEFIDKQIFSDELYTINWHPRTTIHPRRYKCSGA